MAGLKLFGNYMSQPSRTLAIFLKSCGIPFDYQEIDIGKKEHQTENYKATVNRFGKVPAIIHNDFNLTESISILKYLCREYKVADHWYPSDSRQRARVDEYLEWQHIQCRLPLSMYFLTKFLYPWRTGVAPKESEVESTKKKMILALDEVENVWLAKNPYLAGDTISIADLIGASEIEQPRMAGYEPREGRPRLTAWLERVRQDTSPHYDEAHVVLNKVVKKFKGVAPLAKDQK